MLKLPQIQDVHPVTQDELMVLQLLKEIQTLVRVPEGTSEIPIENSSSQPTIAAVSAARLQAAAKLYIDTRETFELIENRAGENPIEKRRKSRASNHIVNPSTGAIGFSHTSASTAVNSIERIQEMFKEFGDVLADKVLDEIRLRKLQAHDVLRFVSYLPPQYQWTAYKEAREEEVAAAYACFMNGGAKTLKQHAEFIKNNVKKDIEILCVFTPDGRLSTIFTNGNIAVETEEAVANKFEFLLHDLYGPYLHDLVDKEVKYLLDLSALWQKDLTANPSITSDTPIVHFYMRKRYCQLKKTIFPQRISTIKDFSFASSWHNHLLEQNQIIVADPRRFGLWWQKRINTASEKNITTIHHDEDRGIFNVAESIDAKPFVPLSKLEEARNNVPKNQLGKIVGQRVLVHDGKDSMWFEAIVTEVEDRKYKLQLKDTLINCPELSGWKEIFESGEWILQRNITLYPAPLDPHFRIHLGQHFRLLLDEVQHAIIEISSVFPSNSLDYQMQRTIWRTMEEIISKGEHIYARYLRSILNEVRNTPVQHQSGSLAPRGVSSRSNQEIEHSSVSLFDSKGVYQVVRQSSLKTSSRTSPNKSPQRSPTSYSTATMVRRRSFASLTTGDLTRTIVESPIEQTLDMSIFERIAHHLLEETEILRVCIQANNIAIARAFAQVFQDKFHKLVKMTHMRLTNPSTCGMEVTLEDYAHLCRLFSAWKLCRQELDSRKSNSNLTHPAPTHPHPHPHKTNNRLIHLNSSTNLNNEVNQLHLEWVRRTFLKMEQNLLDMINLHVNFLHRMFFFENCNFILPGINEQTWEASKPLYSDSRITSGVQFFLFRLYKLVEYTTENLMEGFEKSLQIHEQVQNLLSRMMLDVVSCLALTYERLKVSRARTNQWKMDVIYLVCGIHRSLHLVTQIAPASRDNNATKTSSGINALIEKSQASKYTVCTLFREGWLILNYFII
jgi:hypothetical protein